MPFSQSITGVDGREMSDVFVPAHTPILISALNANRNPELWGEDAAQWKPERWLAPLPESITSAHMPGEHFSRDARERSRCFWAQRLMLL